MKFVPQGGGPSGRAHSSSARAEAWREAAPIYDEGLRVALALEKEKRLAGRNAPLVGELRQARARIDAALLAPAAPQLTPARPNP